MSRTQDGEPAGRGRVPIRPARAADSEALRDFFAGLSAQTRYLRFFGPLAITPAMLRVLSGGGNTDAMVATGCGAIVGHGIAADKANADGAMSTEIGIVVADAWQGQGVGSALVRALITAAQARGATTLAMDVLAGNQQVLAMIAGHWPAARIEHAADCITVRARLPQHQEEQAHARHAHHRRSASPGTANRGNRQPAHATAQLLLARSRALSGRRP